MVVECSISSKRSDYSNRSPREIRTVLSVLVDPEDHRGEETMQIMGRVMGLLDRRRSNRTYFCIGCRTTYGRQYDVCPRCEGVVVERLRHQPEPV